MAFSRKHRSDPAAERLAPPAGPAAGVDKTLTKGLTLIETLCRSSQSRGVSDLANELSLTKSNVHRLLQTLAACGFVSRKAGTDRYVLTTKLWRLARVPRLHDALLAVVHPLLTELVAETGETATFVIIEGNHVVTLDQVETPHTVRVYYAVGDSQPLDQVLRCGHGISGIQRVALSFQSEAEGRCALERIRQQLGHPPEYVDEQMVRIAATRRDGYAVVNGDWMDGVNAVAAAVKGEADDLVGIVISFGPAQRLNAAALDRVWRSTYDIALRLTDRLMHDRERKDVD